MGFFCAYWKKATSIYLSGYSDDQLKDMAKQFYLDDYPKAHSQLSTAGRFFVMNPSGLQFWKNLKNQIKGVWMKMRQLTSQV